MASSLDDVLVAIIVRRRVINIYVLDSIWPIPLRPHVAELLQRCRDVMDTGIPLDNMLGLVNHLWRVINAVMRKCTLSDQQRAFCDRFVVDYQNSGESDAGHIKAIQSGMPVLNALVIM